MICFNPSAGTNLRERREKTFPDSDHVITTCTGLNTRGGIHETYIADSNIGVVVYLPALDYIYCTLHRHGEIGGRYG